MTIAYAAEDFSLVHGQHPYKWAGYAFDGDGNRLYVLSRLPIKDGARLRVEKGEGDEWVSGVGKSKIKG
jgi:hypothetical protein